MIKVGVVGLGAMGLHHARLYSQMGCELVGVADVDQERAREISEKFGTRYFSDYHDLLNRVDAVSIVVPTTSHYPVAMDFLKEGVHCLVEKPLAFDIDEAGEVVRTAKEKHVNLAVGHIEQFNPVVLKLKEIIDEGILGQLLIISTRRVGPFVPRVRDVGIVIDTATHDIGVVNYLIGREPTSVFSRVGSLRNSKDDHAIVILNFGRTTACIEVNWFTPHKVRTLVATGSEGIAYLDYVEQTITLHNSKETEVIDIRKAEPLRLELEDFLASIKEGRAPSVDGEDGMAILKIAIQASASNHAKIPSLV